MAGELKLPRRFKYAMFVSSRCLANNEQRAKVELGIALLLALKKAAGTGARVGRLKAFARGQTMHSKAFFSHIERNHMIETACSCGHDAIVHPGVLDCMRPERPLYRSDGQAKAAWAQDRNDRKD